MVRPEDVKAYIEQGLACDRVEVAGDGHHFEAVIVSAAFRGKSRVDMHRTINTILADELAAGVHALAIQAKAPE